MTSSAAPIESGDDFLKEELETLRILRASLESMKQLVQEVQKDVETAAGNYDSLAEISKRWKAAMEGARILDEREEKGQKS
ncbi:hypothetical protein EX30DRAFT_397001 [Ascodesmis nigricans]|uniref:DASH complex subunit DAD2 n=1 Tax=Ascodesmis nigricans TaxID=341454 RepID=A0A4S2MT70_9PEZI|nr:hypothetical protein EX30DRAFT_397001 [Ascodesmis nigricans]